ncbi:MAG: 16S rRNA (adenine(1518)-N(6)/adenine(1519)-N(6))-dimethyltransferase RsmA [candidate division KSB1 bacterium]|nr:16S rRNA (adenine(1518)-N(6)/adenine(1519)-N(6))-dimethyltransferase RsmA [candidate division KSB1 bacterium]
MGRSARQRLGQHFLIDPVVAARIVEHLQLDAARDVVVEVGAGKGALTEWLAPRCAQLIAVELDYRLATDLAEKFRNLPNVRVICGDFLRQDLTEWAGPERRLRVVGNIPYSLTSAIILRLLEPQHRQVLYDAVLTIQQEVAQRVVAERGTKSYGVLSVLCQVLSDPQVLFGIPPRAFRPQPSVSSAVVRWSQFRPESALGVEEGLFRRLVRSAFGQRRKMLRNGLLWLGSDRLARLTAKGWDLSSRPEDLSPSEWLQLSRDVQQLLRSEEAGELSGSSVDWACEVEAGKAHGPV